MEPIINPPQKPPKTGELLKIKLQCLYGPPKAIIPKIIVISRLENGEIWGECSYGDENARKAKKKIKLNRERAGLLLEKLERLRIPAAPDLVSGCDGGYTEVEIGDEYSKAVYRWWDEAPRGWEELERIADRFVRMMGME